ncbi:MAG: hypothetical protein NTY19_49015 [Planctomycetota bacterium]|nr:hypothetical protein [Planctomycetota bacterium]
MASRPSQFVAIILAAVFAVEGLLAGVAHRDCHSLSACHVVASAAGHAETARDSVDAANPPDRERHAPGPSPSRHDEKHCLACQFLAKHALPVILSTAPCLADRLDLVDWPTVASDPASQISLPLSRGPPTRL